MIDTILKALGSCLEWINGLTGNYIFSILLFAFVIELLLLPLAIKQQKSSIKQAQLYPKVAAIQKKYKDKSDFESLKQMKKEQSDLYKAEKVSTGGTFINLLLQLPILLSLYAIIRNPLLYVMNWSKETINVIAKFLDCDTSKGTIGLISKIKEVGQNGFSNLNGWTTEGVTPEASTTAYHELMQSFDALPNFNLFGNLVNLGDKPSLTTPSLLLIVPVVMFLVFFINTKIVRKLTFQPPLSNEEQKVVNIVYVIMDVILSGIVTYISFAVPALIGIYFIFNSILSTIKQFVILKIMPLPILTEEDYLNAEKELGVNSINCT